MLVPYISQNLLVKIYSATVLTYSFFFLMQFFRHISINLKKKVSVLLLNSGDFAASELIFLLRAADIS